MREAGVLIINDPGADAPLLEVGTLSCVHCSAHFIIRPGSREVRGFCQRCNGPICGPGCAECVPIEQWLENVEAGRPENFRRVFVPVRG